jgi:tetratricopeptide (TPR) repeat protein
MNTPMPEQEEREYRGGTRALLDANQPEKALELCKEGIRHYPDSARLYRLAAVACDRLQRYDDAIAYLTQAISLEPDEAAMYEFRASMHKLAGHESVAVEDYTSALQIEPHPRLYLYRSGIYQREKDFAGAKADLQKVLESDEEYYVLMAFEMLQKIEGKFAEVKQFQGRKLEPAEAMKVISAFRAKYHQGPADLTLNEKGINMLRKRYENAPENLLPDDVIEFRLKRYGSPEYQIPAHIPPLTWLTFPVESIPVTHRIFRHSGFQSCEKVYLSIWSTGNDVFETTPAEVAAFFSDEDRQTSLDYYIFEPGLRWCIVITHDEDYLLAGDFRVF